MLVIHSNNLLKTYNIVRTITLINLLFLILVDYLMFKQLCKQHFPIILFRQPIFTSKTYIHAVTYNHASADGNLRHFCFLWFNIKVTKKYNIIITCTQVI